MLTTSNLKLRQEEVKKNINEKFIQMRKQAVGGLGALIDKPNAPILRKPFTPTIFTPAPMISSLPYLSDAVKVKSNENVLMLSAHIAQQKEARKASLFLDDKKREEYQQKLDEDMIIRNQVEPSGRDLVTRFLVGQIEKRKSEEKQLEERRRRRLDLTINPVIPVAPVAKPAGAIVAEDLGARAPRPDVEERLKGVLERVREKLPPQEKKSFKPEILQASQELATRVEGSYTRKELLTEMNRLRALGVELPPSKDIQSKPAMSAQLVKAKRERKTALDLRPEIKKQYSAPVTAVGGGTVGGGALASILKGNLE